MSGGESDMILGRFRLHLGTCSGRSSTGIGCHFLALGLLATGAPSMQSLRLALVAL